MAFSTVKYVSELFLFISFVLLVMQYYLIYSPERVFVIRFGLMIVTFVLMILASLLQSWSVVFLVLAVILFGLVAFMHRRMVLSRRLRNRR
jgi:hypothetical protein